MTLNDPRVTRLINRNLLARIDIIPIAKHVLRLVPRGRHDPALFIKPRELRSAMEGIGLVHSKGAIGRCKARDHHIADFGLSGDGCGLQDPWSASRDQQNLAWVIAALKAVCVQSASD